MVSTMLYVASFLICFLASTIGAICGIGGGVIIKPTLDAFGMLDVSTISFLSGCTVLCMTTYTLIKNRVSGTSHVERRTGLPLALSAAVGGIVGKSLFSFVKSLSEDPDTVGAVQAACLLAVTLGTLIYTLFKSRIPTHKVENIPVCVVIGLLLGVMSSFLGIGGGPINLVVLFFFFSMETKVAAENSLYIIFFSQLASLFTTLVSGTVPNFPWPLLLLMAFAGIVGGICGRRINRHIDNATVDKLFLGLMAVVILINVFNIFKFV